MIPELKFHKIYLKICTLYNLKTMNTNMTLIFNILYLKSIKLIIWANFSQTTTSSKWKLVYTLVNLKVLNTNLTGFSYSQIIKTSWVLKGNRVFLHNDFHKSLHVRYLTGFWIHQLILLQNICGKLMSTGKDWNKGDALVWSGSALFKYLCHYFSLEW